MQSHLADRSRLAGMLQILGLKIAPAMVPFQFCLEPVATIDRAANRKTARRVSLDRDGRC
jgi:hypothetical protein